MCGRWLLLLSMCVVGQLAVWAQTELPDTMLAQQVVVKADSLLNNGTDSILNQLADSLSLPVEEIERSVMVVEDASEIVKKEREKRDWSTWRPNPQRALWLALVFPGGGQIYNRKYWKLPIVYGGFMGCVYALSWNNMMYRDYQQAYLDIMDDDPNTASYNKFLHLGRQIDSSNIDRYKKIFKSRKDKYRRWRDLSFFVMVGVYAISVIDAYVDAELSEFDISKDLSMKVRPTIMGNGMTGNPLYATSLGVNCSVNF